VLTGFCAPLPAPPPDEPTTLLHETSSASANTAQPTRYSCFESLGTFITTSKNIFLSLLKQKQLLSF
jgi:hypothetical protein